MKITIDRTIWLRGEGSTRSKLLRESDGKMCCVGIALEQCGVPREFLAGRGSVLQVKRDCGYLPEILGWLTANDYDDSVVAYELYAANDANWVEWSDAIRENAISTRFAAHGNTVEFIN